LSDETPNGARGPIHHAVLEALPWALAVVAADGTISYVNRAWPRSIDAVGRPYDQVVGQSKSLPPSVAASLRGAIATALTSDDQSAVLEFAEAGDPPARWLRVRCTSLSGGGAVVVFEDVSAQRRRELELALRADHDPLTGLANRRRFVNEGRRMLALATRRKWGMALLFIDLDAFKRINDEAGHTFGDAVLQQVAKRLTARTRSGDLLARIGGDEFVVLLHDIDAATSVTLAQRYRTTLAEPPVVPGGALPVNASVGIAWFPGAASNLETLLRLADAAMYRAKAERTGVVLVDEAPKPD
jgi:diguanylate cyclase (GGDEF)-like protein